MYGSARARVYYGAGDYSRGLAMAQGYYPGGGFFDFVKKAAGVVGSIASSPIGGIAGKLLKAVPVVGTALSIGSAAGSLLGGFLGKRVEAGGIQEGPAMAAARTLQHQGLLPANRAAGIGGLPRMQVERGRPRGKRRRSSSKRRSTGRSSRRRRRAGDYGDDWSGNRPSRAKGTGRFLTRAGGRRRHAAKHHRRRSRGQRVSFTTKSGKRVSFNAKGDGDGAT